ncbi:hypothetical protein, partial [Methylosinus sp. Ce-a6]|uniref:hypothetical protein n=1 Tax=Methylosinus sp. Ce-a6 TaxID=2172005 RepID=UPI001AEF262B
AHDRRLGRRLPRKSRRRLKSFTRFPCGCVASSCKGVVIEGVVIPGRPTARPGIQINDKKAPPVARDSRSLLCERRE